MATLYFNTFAATGAGDYDFWNPSNWFSDSDCTIPSAAPTSTDDAVFLSSCLGFSLEITPHVNNAYLQGGVYDPNTGSPECLIAIVIVVDGLLTALGTTAPTILSEGTIIGNCYFGGDYGNNMGTIYGDVTFGPYSGPNNGIINGNCIFEEENFEVGYGTINGDCEIDSIWEGTKVSYLSINGNATFRGYTDNSGSISGNVDAYYPAQRPLNGTILGSINYYGYPPVNALTSTESPFSGSGYSYVFDGQSGLKYENTGQFAVGTGDFTIEWFQKITSLDNFPRVFEIGAYPSTSIGVSIEGGTFYFWDSNGPHFGSDVSSVLNQWVHFRVVRASGVLTAYLNGISFASESNSNNISDTSTPLSIGCEILNGFGFSENTGFQGNISNFRWQNVALNTGNFIPPSAPLESNSNTIILVAGAIELINGCLAYWNLNNDGSGNVSLLDSTGNGNTLANNNGVELGSGIIGGDAVWPSPFSGGRWLQCETISTTGDISLSFWIKPSQFNDKDFITTICIGDVNYGRILPIIFPDGSIFCIFGGTGAYINQSVVFDSWNHICLVAHSFTGDIQYYVNGVASSTILNFGSIGNLNQVFIGVANDQAFLEGQYVYEGSIDEVGAWNRILIQQEITSLYNNGMGLSYPFPLETLYYTNASGDGLWSTLANWNTLENGSGDNPTSIPWSGGYFNYNLADAAGATGVYLDTNISYLVTGECNIPMITAYEGYEISGGVFSGEYFTNGAVINDATITGDYFYNFGGVYGGVFSGNYASTQNSGIIYGGTFTGSFFLNDISDSGQGIQGGSFNINGFENYDGIAYDNITINLNGVPFTGEWEGQIWNNGFWVSAVPLTNNLLAYWKLDNDGSGAVSLIDSTGNGNTLTNNGSELTIGKIKGCANFTDGGFLYANPVNLSDDFSNSFWLKFNNSVPSEDTTIIGAGTQYGYQLNVNRAGVGTFVLVPANLSDELVYNYTFSPDQWYLVSIVRSNGYIKLYINGTYISENYYNGNLTCGDPFQIGGYVGFDGELDEIGFWSRSLSPEEVSALYNNGMGLTYPFIPPSPSTMRKISLGTLLNLPFPVNAIYDKRPIFGVSTLLNTPFYINK